MRYYITGAVNLLSSLQMVMDTLTATETALAECEANEAALLQQIEELKKNGGGIPGKGFSDGLRTWSAVTIDSTIGREYIVYIQRYGIPQDGIFVPRYLVQIANELAYY